MKILNKKTGKIIDIDYIELYNSDVQFYAGSISELNENWEDYEPKKSAKPKRYRLLKDLPTFKAGDEFFTDEYGSLWLEQNIGEQPNTSRVMAYHGKTIDKFPNILEEWFEEIKPAEPLIKNEKVRKAVRAWADAVGTTHAYLHIEHEEPSTFYVYNLGVNCHYIQIAIHDQNPIKEERLYAITELCGEEE